MAALLAGAAALTPAAAFAATPPPPAAPPGAGALPAPAAEPADPDSGGAGAGGAVTWGLSPAPNPAYDVARANYSYAAEAGDVIQDGIVIDNPSAAPIRLDVYAADA
ncbi:MAG: hypothetical protein LBT54_00755, partial [Bifidobacteriaceae bacterium]|nr:hypothetical protein [Bifidobacteriaceae bacterium]